MLYAYTFAPFATVLVPLQLPLLPLVTCFRLATSGTLDASDAWAPLVAIAYVAGLVALASARFAQRDLVLH